jgi:nicotinate-nucleotide adenylyltransferase
MRIGLFGGSFDPVHRGHTGVAAAVADALGLERVWLLPAAQAPLRGRGARASGAQRLAMLRLALDELRARGERRLEVEELELRRGGVSYTVETLRELHARHPDATWVWIVGEDQLARLGTWREPAELARLAEWAVYTRPGTAPVEAVRTGLPPGLRLHRVEPRAGRWEISSTAVRERLARGEPCGEWLADKVVEYIRENALYRGL